MPYFAFVSTNAVLVKKKQMDFQDIQKSLPQWGRGTAIAVDEAFP